MNSILQKNSTTWGTDELGISPKRMSRIAGEQIAIPDSDGDERRPAPSHANCCPISTIDSAVPAAVTWNLCPEFSASETWTASFVPSGKTAAQSAQVQL